MKKIIKNLWDWCELLGKIRAANALAQIGYYQEAQSIVKK